MGIISKDIGIDLGTSNIRIHLKGKGVVLSEPAVVAINQINNYAQIPVLGERSWKMSKREPTVISSAKYLPELIAPGIFCWSLTSPQSYR